MADDSADYSLIATQLDAANREIVRHWLMHADKATLIAWLAPILAAKGNDDLVGWPAILDELDAACDSISPYDG